jgi:DNA-directed RNA polymerase subunit RPC12/RpoP
MIEFECSECGKNLRFQDEAAGKWGRCPECGETLLVPHIAFVPLQATDFNSIPLPPASPRPRKRLLWVAIVVVAAVIAALSVPKFLLWFGIVLLALCGGAFVPRAQGVSHRVLRLNPTEKWRSGVRVTMYGLIAVVLILVGWIGSEKKAEPERVAVKRAAEQAERQRLANDGNAQVVALVAEAEAAWKQGKSNLAEEKLGAATKALNATDLTPVRQFRTCIANANVEALMAEATNALIAGDIDRAQEKIKATLAVPHADALDAARKLYEQIGNATDSARIRTTLMEMPDEAFQRLKVDGTMPTHLLSGYQGLDRRTAELATAQIEQVAAAREERRLTQLEAERKRQEDERLAVEAARKAEEKRQAQEKARREAPQKGLKDRLDAYVAMLNAADVKGIKNVSGRKIGDDIWEATITVENLWHIRHYQVRLQDAQTLWQAWAGIASPRDLDNARIKLVDLRGNEVGGSRLMAGSLIWVKKD